VNIYKIEVDIVVQSIPMNETTGVCSEDQIYFVAPISRFFKVIAMECSYEFDFKHNAWVMLASHMSSLCNFNLRIDGVEPFLSFFKGLCSCHSINKLCSIVTSKVFGLLLYKVLILEIMPLKRLFF
jgi:hypothetical protein